MNSSTLLYSRYDPFFIRFPYEINIKEYQVQSNTKTSFQQQRIMIVIQFVTHEL